MSDNNVGADSVELDEHTDDDTVVDGGEGQARQARAQRSLHQAYLSAWNAAARARVAASQRGLSQARAAAWDATGRARAEAAARRTATPTEETPDIAAIGTLVDRARAYRPHLVAAAVAVAVAVLITVLRRRAAARRTDAVVDGADGAVIGVLEIKVSALPLNGEGH